MTLRPYVAAVIALAAALSPRWGYPGGTCAFLIKEHYVTCHNDETLVPDWSHIT